MSSMTFKPLPIGFGTPVIGQRQDGSSVRGAFIGSVGAFRHIVTRDRSFCACLTVTVDRKAVDDLVLKSEAMLMSRASTVASELAEVLEGCVADRGKTGMLFPANMEPSCYVNPDASISVNLFSRDRMVGELREEWQDFIDTLAADFAAAGFERTAEKRDSLGICQRWEQR